MCENVHGSSYSDKILKFWCKYTIGNNVQHVKKQWIISIFHSNNFSSSVLCQEGTVDKQKQLTFKGFQLLNNLKAKRVIVM